MCANKHDSDESNVKHYKPVTGFDHQSVVSDIQIVTVLLIRSSVVSC